MTALFISDLHLHEDRPHTTDAFLAFLQQEVIGNETLYILGDLFDAWIGDDDERALPSQVADNIRRAVDRGTTVFFQHGNRDFLLGHRYARRCGMHILPELFQLEVMNERWLLAHGDQFCTGDSAYQQFRAMVRRPTWQKEILSKPLAERRQLAMQLREKSRESNSLKATDIMDVAPDAVARTMAELKCCKLIHGHTHRPARHDIRVAGEQAERIVLGEWDANCWYLRQQGTNLELIEKRLT